jgi:hypothetical protein
VDFASLLLTQLGSTRNTIARSPTVSRDGGAMKKLALGAMQLFVAPVAALPITQFCPLLASCWPWERR